MKMSVKNHKTVAVVASILAVVILLTSIPLVYSSIGEKDKNAFKSASTEDRRIASEISNETGVAVEQVYDLKMHGRSWEQVLNILKNRVNSKKKNNKTKMQNTLINSGLDEDFLKKLRKEGFSEQGINQVKMLEERVVFQLQEISAENRENQIKSDKPNTDTYKVKEDDKQIFAELAKKIDIKDAVYFMLKLEKAFGSYEKVFDEYLFALQLDIDLNEYIKDRKSYEKKKDEKKLLMDEKNFINIERIEAKSIELLQKINKPDDKGLLKNETVNSEIRKNDGDGKSPLPDIPNVEVEDIKPQNPTDEVMNEIKEINPMNK